MDTILKFVPKALVRFYTHKIYAKQSYKKQITTRYIHYYMMNCTL